MNEFKIYQVKEEHIREYGYASMRELLWTHHAEAVDGSEIYRLPREPWELVYTWRTEKDPSLDYIFTTFNRTHAMYGVSGEATPEDFEGHSMSVSDIIEYPDGRLWFCDSLGWKEIQWTEEEP